MVEEKKPRLASGLALCSVSSIAVGMELVGQANVLDWRGDLRFGGLTVFSVKRISGKPRGRAGALLFWTAGVYGILLVCG
jgi:hypothetical protein